MTDRREDGYQLPGAVDPERIGVCVPVPNDPGHRRAFLDALYQLSWARNWQHDGTQKGLDVAKVWTEIYTIVADRLLSEVCEGGEPVCIEYPPTAGFIRYGPQDPRYQPDYVPTGYAFAPWYFATPYSNFVYQSQDGDILTSFERMPAFVSFPPDVENEQYPSFTINLTGSGSVEVHLRSLVVGSVFLYVTDTEPLTPVFVDVNKDVVQLPPETHDYSIVEYEWDEPGFHWIRFHMIPRFDIEEAPLAYGGGLIKVVVCGFGVDEDGSMDCCDEILQALEQLKIQGASDTNFQRKALYDGTPDSIHINAPTITFNQQEADPSAPEQALRDTALCAAVTQYVYNRVAAAIYAIAAAAGLALGAGGALVVFGGPLAWIVGGIIAIIGALTLDALEAAAEDTEALQQVICDLYDALEGATINQTAFTSALNGIIGETTNEETIIACLQAHPSALENWLYFLDLLGSGYDAALGGVNVNCSCEDLCDLDADFEVAQEATPWTLVEGVFVTAGIRVDDGGSAPYSFDLQLNMPDGCQIDGIEYDAWVNSGYDHDGIELHWKLTAGGGWTFSGWKQGLPAMSDATYSSITSGVIFPETVYGVRLLHTESLTGVRLREVRQATL